MAGNALATRPDTDEGAATGGAAVRRLAGYRRYALILLTLLVVSLGMNGLIVDRLPGMTAVDGLAYVDAYFKASEGDVASPGDTIDRPALNVIACRGLYRWGGLMMTCEPGGHAKEDEAFATWDATRNSAAAHAPTYFFATAWLVRAVSFVMPGSQDPIDLARILGAVWFSLGALLLVRAAALWGARPWAAAAALLAFVPTPFFVSIQSFVTPDAMGLLVSSAVALGVTLWWQGRMPASLLFGFGLITSIVKQTFILAAVTGAVVLALLWWSQRRRGLGETVRAGAWLLGGAMAAQAAWQLLKITTAQEGLAPASRALETKPSVDGLARLLFTPGLDIPSVGAANLIPMPVGATTAALGLGFLCAAAAGGALLYRKSNTAVFSLALGGVLGMAFGAVLLSLITYVNTRLLLAPAPRFVLGAWPFYVLPLLLLTHRRVLLLLLAALAVLSAGSWLLWAEHPAFS